jgi:VanZ family protein
MASPRGKSPYDLWLAFSVLLILVGAWMPGGWSSAALSPFPYELHVDKVGHFTGFCIYGWLLARGTSVNWWRVFVLAVALGVLTEVGQMFVPGRHPSAWDSALDVTGAMCGALLQWIPTVFRTRRATGSQNRPHRL